MCRVGGFYRGARYPQKAVSPPTQANVAWNSPSAEGLLRFADQPP